MSPLAETQPAPPAPRFLRRTGEGEVRRFNTLVGTSRTFPFTWSGQPAALRFTACDQAPPSTTWFRVRLDNHTFDVGLPDLPEPSALGVAFAGIEIAALPEELLLGVLEAWLSDASSALQKQGVNLRLEARQTTAPLLPAAFGWEISRTPQARFLAGSLHAESEALNFLHELAQRAQPQPARNAEGLTFPVQIAVAHLALPLTMLRELAVGDALFPSLTAVDWQQGRCELWSGQRCLGHAVRQQRNVKIFSMKNSLEPQAVATTGSLPVDALPVALTFDVGQIELTVGQLRTLGEGYTFELPGDPDRLVAIRANGREIGHGELVEVGVKVGVRITNWNLT